MGCWEETCAVTRAPIYRNEQVVVVIPRQYIDIEKRHIMWHNSGDYILWGVESIFHGIYDNYGWINETSEPENFRKLVSFFVKSDVWNEIKEMSFNPNPSWQYDTFERMYPIYTMNPPEMIVDGNFYSTYRPKEQIKKEDLETYHKLICFAQACRIDLLAGDVFRGCTTDEADSYSIMAKMIQKQAKLLKNYHKNL